MTLVILIRWLAGAALLGAMMTVALLNLMPDRRELRTAVPVGTPTSDPAFFRSMAGLFGSNLLGGNRIETLLNGDQIFPAMLGAIRSAETTINFETYIYWSGEIGWEFALALAERASAGVEVRVLIDWVGSQSIESGMLQTMEDAGVRIVRFRPLRWYTLDRINNRTHRKLLVVDGRVGFTGGVGIGDEWRGDARTPDEWRETHFRVTGPVVAMLQGAFASNWVEDTGDILRGEAHFPALEPTGTQIAQLVISSTGSRNYIHLMLMTAIAAAERNLRIATPYFVPDDVAIGQLVAAARRGVQVDILVPGPVTDMPIVRQASRNFWGELLAAGVRIHEYQPTFLHTKMLIVDEAFASVGSTNFDERSFRLNDEANLNIFDADFAREQIEIFERDLTQSRPITLAEWQDRSWLTRMRDWGWSRLRPQL
jgi:cardiolipin synthase A/B